MSHGYLGFLLDPAHWTWAPDGLLTRIAEHLHYTGLAVLIASAIALPMGAVIGHTGCGRFLAVNLANATRALPTFGLISLLVTLVGLGLLPVLIALVVLAVPPILAGTHAGVHAVDRDVVDAARGMGMRPARILFAVELPIAAPLIISGVRSAAAQVIATATVAAYVGLGGLGRPLVDGLSVNRYDRVVAGAVLVAVLAVIMDVLFGALRRLLVSPGLSALEPRVRRTRG